ncbi:signal transduction histidine kinase [Saonia flava]|uniref:histidine kinase n=1 Tax=Saonia flava TaxID=523696 RepID=A0A846QZF8_9FLAO|nr:HAMP domain-containing sensor histidine kinase [Saonia flava]NJB71045.1 signal transduction histidine kinase [Saonia flava]
MHSLLKRQIRKYLPENLSNNPEIEVFLESVESSYKNFDEQVMMIQRATAISSEELFVANRKLRKEAESQKKILQALEGAMVSLYRNNPNTESEAMFRAQSFDPIKLAKDIEDQAQEIARITSEKDVLLTNLEQQNEALNNYAHMVSHDLKSPIRNMDALLNWIKEDDAKNFTDSSKSNIDLLFQNLAKMDALINGILTHATIDSLEEKATEMDLNLLVDEIKNTVFIPDNVSISCSKKLPSLKAQKFTLEQLFKNLITNAISASEHLESGEIFIDVEDKDDFWEFSVKDNGKGIPEQYKANIFDMFKKLEDNYSATGIGLSLVKKIVNLYEGDIWLTSEVNKGTTFFFTLKK